MEHAAILGFIAAALGTVSLLPQVVKLWRVRSTTSISLMMYLIICFDSVLWLIYGITLQLHPLIFQSLVTLVCSLAIIIMKVLWK